MVRLGGVCLAIPGISFNRSIQTQKDYKMKISYNKKCSGQLHISQHTAYNLRLKEEISAVSVDLGKNTSGEFDFHDEKNVGISGDVSNVRLLFNSKANYIALSVMGMRGSFDFSGVRILYIDHCDISKATIKFNPNARFIDLYRVKGLRGYLDFSNVQELKLGEGTEETCLDGVSGIKFNPNGLVFGISDAKRRLLESAYLKHERNS